MCAKKTGLRYLGNLGELQKPGESALILQNVTMPIARIACINAAGILNATLKSAKRTGRVGGGFAVTPSEPDVTLSPQKRAITAEEHAATTPVGTLRTRLSKSSSFTGKSCISIPPVVEPTRARAHNPTIPVPSVPDSGNFKSAWLQSLVSPATNSPLPVPSVPTSNAVKAVFTDKPAGIAGGVLSRSEAPPTIDSDPLSALCSPLSAVRCALSAFHRHRVVRAPMLWPGIHTGTMFLMVRSSISWSPFLALSLKRNIRAIVGSVFAISRHPL